MAFRFLSSFSLYPSWSRNTTHVVANCIMRQEARLHSCSIDKHLIGDPTEPASMFDHSESPSVCTLVKLRPGWNLELWSLSTLALHWLYQPYWLLGQPWWFASISSKSWDQNRSLMHDLEGVILAASLERPLSTHRLRFLLRQQLHLEVSRMYANYILCL